MSDIKNCGNGMWEIVGKHGNLAQRISICKGGADDESARGCSIAELKQVIAEAEKEKEVVAIVVKPDVPEIHVKPKLYHEKIENHKRSK